MNRKTFIEAAGTVAMTSFLPLSILATPIRESDIIPYKRPPYLKAGDTIAVTAPSGFITLEQIQPAVTVMQGWGYTIKMGSTVGKRDYIFGGTDEERLQDFQTLLDDPNVKAIMCARGGYGTVRIVDRINWKKFRQKPKWIIGFSDITVVLNHIHQNLHTATIHSKMCNSFPDIWFLAAAVQKDTINSIKDALEGKKKMEYTAEVNKDNRPGTAKGVLIGGNLKTIESLTGSASDIDTKGKILFVEDTDEYLYSIDRMFWNLKRTGKLDHLKALIVGGFNIKPDSEEGDFGRRVEDIVLEKVKEYTYPVCFDFPVGHQRNNFALKCGVPHQINITQQEVTLKEIV